MKLKVLKLLPYMKRLDRGGFPEGYFTKFEPRVGRDGYYLQGNECWFEFDGVGYTNDSLRNSFLYDLRGYDRVYLGAYEIKVIHELHGKLTASLRGMSINELMGITYAPDIRTRLAMFKRSKVVRSTIKSLKGKAHDLRQILRNS